MTDDPRAILDAEPMSRFQWIVVAIMVGLNALDGFDVLSISFASPGIAAAWHVDRAALGLVLSMELIGMAVGSILLGRLADRLGRRRIMLLCLAIPKIVVGMGFSPPLAAGVLVWASVGGATGAITLALLTARARLLWLTVAAMVLSTGLVIWFGQGQKDLTGLSLVAAMAGFATNAGIVGLYGLIAQAFPTELRATATGLIIGVGRGGSALAPALAGWLFAIGKGMPVVALLMALGSAVGAIALFADRRTLAALG